MRRYKIISSLSQLKEFAEKMKHIKEFAFDTETTSLRYKKLELVAISIYAPGIDPTCIFFNFRSPYRVRVKEGRKSIEKVEVFHRTDAIPIEEGMAVIRPIFAGAQVIGHNLKFDYKVAHKYQFHEFHILHDTLLMSYLLDCNSPNDLKTICRDVGEKMETLEETLGMKPSNVVWPLVNWDRFGRYACHDAYTTYLLAKHYEPQIVEHKLENVYRNFELPLVKVVGDMEIAGVKINVDYLKELSVKAHKRLDELAEEIYELAGVSFNINSPKQLGDVLFNRMGYEPIEKTKSGEYSTDEGTLKELAYKGIEIASQLLEYRKLSKLTGTYIDAIPEMVDDDGRLRGSFNQAGARTGRFSSSEPNLQNQPTDAEFPIRNAFIPESGYLFLVFDWKTIEIRVMAHLSKDPVLTDILRQGRDVHQETADRISALAHVPITRYQGKTLNFAILYGMQADSLAYTLNMEVKKAYKNGKITFEEYKRSLISPVKADKLIEGYYRAYKGFREWSNKEISITKDRGYVRTLSGRKRAIPELQHKRTFSEGSRITINTAVQGGAADLMKKGLKQIAAWYFANQYDARLLMTVHDEVVIECREDLAEKVLQETKKIMEDVFPNCSVPILADCGIFHSWGGMKLGEASPVKSKIPSLIYSKLMIYNLIK